jgi:outer membrane lipoprotein-sorting protein
MRTVLVLGLALALSAQGRAYAQDPYSAISSMRTAFSQVHAATAIERSSNGSVATVEFTSPNKYHITTSRSEIVLSGDVEYSKDSGGSWKSDRNGAEHQAMVESVWQLAGPTEIDVHKLYTITALGSKTIGGQSVRGYRLHDKAIGYDETIWVGSDNLPVVARIALPTETLDIRYMDYNNSSLVATP